MAFFLFLSNSDKKPFLDRLDTIIANQTETLKFLKGPLMAVLTFKDLQDKINLLRTDVTSASDAVVAAANAQTAAIADFKAFIEKLKTGVATQGDIDAAGASLDALDTGVNAIKQAAEDMSTAAKAADPGPVDSSASSSSPADGSNPSTPAAPSTPAQS